MRPISAACYDFRMSPKWLSLLLILAISWWAAPTDAAIVIPITTGAGWIPPFAPASPETVSALQEFIRTDAGKAFLIQHAELEALSGLDSNAPFDQALVGALTTDLPNLEERLQAVSQDPKALEAFSLDYTRALLTAAERAIGPLHARLAEIVREAGDTEQARRDLGKFALLGLWAKAAVRSITSLAREASVRELAPDNPFSILADGELQRHFQSRREALSQKLPESVVLLSGGRLQSRNGDVDAAFRQKSDFLYLSGVEKPGHHLLIDAKSGRSILFIPRSTQKEEVWTGPVPTPEQAGNTYGFSETAYADELPAKLKELLGGRTEVHTDQDTGESQADLFKSLAAAARQDLFRGALDALRVVKTAVEVKLIKIANDISSAAHLAAMELTRPGQREYQLQAAFEKILQENGLPRQAYPSIVGAGINSAILHYGHNGFPVMGKPAAPIKEGELVLIDASGEFMGYASDITRTFPAGDKFTPRQRDIYSIVLAAQLSAIHAARPGIIMKELHRHSALMVAEGLKWLGILKGEAEALVNSGALGLFYPHGLSHMMGLDVHDVRPGGPETKLEPGHVLTVEPGIYFISGLLNDPRNREKYKNQVDFALAESYLDFGGVRIEDDIAVEKNGPPTNLTDAPKELPEIEALRGRP